MGSARPSKGKGAGCGFWPHKTPWRAAPQVFRKATVMPKMGNRKGRATFGGQAARPLSHKGEHHTGKT